MARFKFVRISKRKVEVQKVRFKIKLGMLLVAFACAFIVWLYVKGSTPPELPPPEETSPVEEISSETEAEWTAAETSESVHLKEGSRGNA